MLVPRKQARMRISVWQIRIEVSETLRSTPHSSAALTTDQRITS